MSKITTVPASVLTPAVMMKQCEEVMANMKESDKQRDEAHEQSGSPSSEQRDGCSQTVVTLTTSPRTPRSPQQREACVQTMVTSETGSLHAQSGWCFVGESTFFSVISEPLEDKYSELNDEEFMLATIDHRSRTRKLVHDGLGWRLESELVEGDRQAVEEDDEDRSSGDARLERPDNVNEEEKTTITMDSDQKQLSHAQAHAPERAQERKTLEQVLPSGQRIKDTRPRRQEDDVEGEEGGHAVNELSTCGHDQSPGIG